MTSNIILNTDSYKASHFLQYPPNTTGLRAYFEARTENEQIKFFGLQIILKQVFSQIVTMDDVDEAKAVFEAHGLPFPYEGWKRVVEVHGGRIPLRIRAAKEGSVIPSNNVLFTVESTDPELYWLVTWFETALARVWYPTTVATRSYDLYNYIKQVLEETSDNPAEELPFKLHDFGSRGASSRDTAGIGGAAHLTNFKGSDTVDGLMYARRYYGADMAGYSIPAAEHSTITAWGRYGELDAFKNMLDKFAKPGAILAVVSDSWNIYKAIDELWGEELKQRVIESGATVVIRPDSGDPVKQVLNALRSLGRAYGYTENSKGYKVLNRVRVIQGDGVSPERIKRILDIMKAYKWSAENVAFGMGAELLQKVNRDTHKFAYKVCEAEVNGSWRPVYKQPVDSPMKASKSGMLDLVRTADGYKTIDRSKGTHGAHGVASEMRIVYENGKFDNEVTWDEVTE